MPKFNHTRFQARKYRQAAEEEGGEAGSVGGEGGDGGNKPSIEDLQKQLSELKSANEKTIAENERLSHKINEANKHKKEAERREKQQAREKAEAEGNHEQLYKSAMEELEKERAEHNELITQIRKKDIHAEAVKIALSMNPINDNAAQDLAGHIAKRLKYADDGIKVTDEAGNLTVSSLDDLKNELIGSDRYSFYIKGNQSSGGGASGGSSGGGATKEIGRSDFNKLDPAAKMKFTKDGGKVIND